MKPTLVKKTRFNKWVWRNFPHCAEVVKLITTRMDGNLSWLDTIRMKIHMISCPPCVNFLNHLKLLRHAMQEESGNFYSEDSAPKLSSDAQNRMKQALKNAATGAEN